MASIINTFSEYARLKRLQYGGLETTGTITPSTPEEYIAIGIQPYNDNLYAIANLSGTSGFLKKTAQGTWVLDTNTYLTEITSQQITTALGYTPVTNARTLTINGVTYDLTADRSWTIAAGVTSFNTRTGAITLSSNDVTTALGFTPENAANKGVVNGYASLDGSGLVPSTQLPSYVDDVLEYTNLAAFPVTGTTGKIYVDLATNKIYRWSGSTYIEVSPTVGVIWGSITGTLANQTDLQSALDSKQGLDADLTAIASLSGTTGFLVKTAADTWTLDTNVYLTSSALTSYVPYTGATTALNLGNNNLRANRIYGSTAITIDNSSSAGLVNFYTYTFGGNTYAGQGYVAIGSSLDNGLSVYYTNSSTTRIAHLNGASLTANRTYTLPDVTGTFALTSDLSSYVPTTRSITINGTTYDLSANRSWTINSMVYPGAGIAVSTGLGWGTSITDNSSNWNTAYGWGNHASAGYLTSASAASTYQPLDGDLTSIAGLAGTSGLLKKTAANTWTLDTNTYLTSFTETDPTVGAHIKAITSTQISNWDTAYGWGNHASAGYLTTTSAASTYVSLSGSYSNPAWITSLAWSKITGAPAFLTSYTETDTLATVTGRGNSTSSIIIVNQVDGAYTFRTSAAWGGWGRNIFTIADGNAALLGALGGYGGSGTTMSYMYFGTAYNATWLQISSSAVNSQVALQQSGNQVLHAGNYTTYAVPTTRTITINGTSYDLSANRSWTISAGSTALSGLSDVTITSVANGQLLQYSTASSKWVNWTPNYLTSYTETDTLATVTGRGSTTTTSITAVGLKSSSGGSISVVPSTYGSNGFIAFRNTGDTATRWNIYNYTGGGTTYGSLNFSDGAGTDRFVINEGGAATFSSSVTASSFSGAGTGLTGTASSLSIGGNAATATIATQLISPNGATVVAADSAMPSAGQSFIHTLGLGPSGNDGHILGMTWANTTTSYGAQIWLDTDPNNRMAFRSRSSAGVWTGWNEVIHSSNYSSYALPLSGGTLSGSITISYSGAVASYIRTTTNTSSANFGLGNDISANIGGIAVFGSAYAASAQYRTDGTYVYSNRAGGLTLHAEGAYSMYLATNGTTAITISSGQVVTFASSITAGGIISAPAASGFANSTYTSGRNPIWRFGNADAYGLSYFQGTGGYTSGVDMIGLHFGTASVAGSQFSFVQDGRFIATGAITATSFNGAGTGLTGTASSLNIGGSAGSVAWTNVSGRPTALSSFTNDGVFITASYLDDYTRGNYRVYSDYGGSTTWYIRSNGQYIWANGHDWTTSFRLSLSNNGTDNGSWVNFGQQDSNATNGRYRGLSIRKYAGSANVLGDLEVGNSYITTAYVTGSTNNARIVSGSDWGFRAQNDSGYIQFGPANTSYAHIYTDRGSFYFNKELDVNGNRVLNAGNYSSYAQPILYKGISTSGDFQTFQSSVGVRFDQVNATGGLSNPPPGYNYGGILSTRGDNFGFQLWGSHTGDFYYKTQWSSDSYSGWRYVVTSLNIGSQSVSYATSSGSISGFNNPTTANTGNTIVYRDGSGNFSAGTITATLSGNASTATSATNATNSVYLTTQFLSTGSTNVSTGSSYVIRNENGNGGNPVYSPVLHLAASDTMFQISSTYGTSGNGTMYYRQGYSGSWGNWLTMISSANIGSQSVNYATSSGSISGYNNPNTSSVANTIVYRDSSAYIYAASYVANGDWFRNNTSGTGLYNSANVMHFYSESTTGFSLYSGNGSTVNIQMKTTGNVTRGYLYADSSSQIGFLNSSGGWSLRVDNSGNTYVTGTLTESSSVRYKENIADLTYSLEDALKLRPVEYTKIGTSHKEVGFIAEEVNDIIPEAVMKNKDGSVESISYGRLTAVLLKAVKEQQQQINELKELLNTK